MEVTYEFAIFPDQEKVRPVPEVGDVFVVTAIYRDVLDTHWGKCAVVVLRPMRVRYGGRAQPLVVVDEDKDGDVSYNYDYQKYHPWGEIPQADAR